MAALTLSKILKANRPLTSLLESLGEDVSILDLDGKPVWGNSNHAGTEQVPILLDGQPFGWVAGGSRLEALAGLITWFAVQESEKKSLAAEVLDRYRELNLLYHLSETMGASPYPGAIASTALSAAIRIIPAQIGQILLKTGNSQTHQNLAAYGSPYSLVPACPLVERVLASGKAELTNATPGDEVFVQTAGQSISVVCAPLKTEKNVLGAILLASPGEKSFTAGELKLLNTIALQAAPMIEISRLYQIEIEKTRLESELQMAREVQESLLPEKMPQIRGWQFDQRWRPMREVSGDFYDLINEGPQRLGLVTADVTDKGMPASLFMVFVRSVLRASVTRRTAPDQALTNANKVICQDSYRGLFATLFYARLNTESGEFTYVNAGHPPAVLYCHDLDELQLLPRTGMPLGVDSQATYTSRTVQMLPGDFLLLYTDGLIEAENAAGEEFGIERLMNEILSQRTCSACDILDHLEKSLSAYTSPRPIADDLTLMLLRRN